MENKDYILNTAKQIITEEVEKAGYKGERNNDITRTNKIGLFNRQKK